MVSTLGWKLTDSEIAQWKAGAIKALAESTDKALYVPGGFITAGSPLMYNTTTTATVIASPPVKPPPEPEPAPQPAPPTPPATVRLAGLPVPTAAVHEAIAVLESAPRNQVSVPLQKATNPVADLDFDRLVSTEVAWTRRTENSPTNLRGWVLAALRRAVDPYAAGPFRVDPTTGYLINVVDLDGRDRNSVKAVAEAVGNGRVVGRGYSRMTDHQRAQWLTAWHNGDLAECYAIESGVAAAHPRHPGAPGHPDTHRVIWNPAVAGEIPAGADVPGCWPSPYVDWPRETVTNYVLAARCAYPGHLGTAARRLWAREHLLGSKQNVDARSQSARRRGQGGGGELLRVQPTEPLPDYQQLLAEDQAVRTWNTAAVLAYLTDHDLPTTGPFPYRADRAQNHLTEARRLKAIDDARLRFRLAADQPTLAGWHRKALLLDQHDRTWLFKPAPSPEARFRADTEHEAHQLARAWGFFTAESRLIEFDGQHGQAQLMHPAHRDLLGVTGADFAALTRAQLCAIAREHVLDWALDNDDCHGANIVITTDGTAIGIDKGRAWRYFGGWPGLTGDERADTNCALVYTKLYAAIADGHLPPADVAAMYESAITQARRMRLMPDDDLAAYIRRAVAHRPHYRPSSYQRPVAGAPTNVDELVAAAVARKHALVEDFTDLWRRIHVRAGLAEPQPCTATDINPQGHRLLSGLHDPDLAAGIAATRNFGTATFLSGTDIEDAHLLWWRERRPDGSFVIRGQGKLRPQAADRFYTWCASQRDAGSAAVLGGEPGVYQAIIAAAKTVSYHCVDKEYNPLRLAGMRDAQSRLRQWLTTYQSLADTATSAADAARFTDWVRMCRTYLGYIDSIEAHRADGTASKPGDYPRFVAGWPAGAEPAPAVTRTYARRDAASTGIAINLTPDGDLQLIDRELCDTSYSQYGQPGEMYLITLAGGETVDFRHEKLGTPLSTSGQVQFTVSDPAQLDASMTRIVNLFGIAGVPLLPADSVDLELFYWRHLTGILAERRDSRRDGRTITGGPVEDRFQQFWAYLDQHRPTDRFDEIVALRTAFSLLTTRENIDAFVAAGRHLPRFGHPDLRDPTRAAGKPYWVRFDITHEWAGKSMPAMFYRSGPSYVVQTGVALATEARMRVFGIFKGGQSSYVDMIRGSAGFIFTRQNQERAGNGMTVFLRPEVLTRTSNYAFSGDLYGSIASRSGGAYWDFETATSFGEGCNELLIKDCVTLNDDIEILVFPSNFERSSALTRFAALGVTELRGVPLTVRFVVLGDGYALDTAITAVRATYPARTS